MFILLTRIQSVTSKNNLKYLERKFVGKFCIPSGGTHPYESSPQKPGQLAAFSTLQGSCAKDVWLPVIQLTLTS
jgi:hypothetical protein